MAEELSMKKLNDSELTKKEVIKGEDMIIRGSVNIAVHRPQCLVAI